MIVGRFPVLWIILLLSVLLHSCASTPDVDEDGANADAAEQTEGSEGDPFEGFNRAMFGFNDGVDRYVYRPLVYVYTSVLPDPAEDAVSRFYSNLTEPRNTVNGLLQLKFKQAGNDFGRFVVNSTVGILGFFDVAQHMGLEQGLGEDFGQTFAHWGVGTGPYLVLPFLGPSNLRDAPGLYLDAQIHPVTEIDNVPLRNTIIGVGLIDLRLSLLKAESFVEGDRYTFIRDAYLQRREYLVNDGKLEDDFGGDELEDEEFDF